MAFNILRQDQVLQLSASLESIRTALFYGPLIKNAEKKHQLEHNLLNILDLIEDIENEIEDLEELIHT